MASRRTTRDPDSTPNSRESRIVWCTVSCLGGVLLACSFIFYEHMWWSAWIACYILVVVIDRNNAKRSALYGYFFGLGMSVVSHYWLPETISRFSNYALWLSWLMLVGLAAYLALQIAVLGLLVGLWKRRHPNTVLAIPTACVALEFCWVQLFPWRLGHTQFPSTHLVQVAEVTGAYGVSFIMAWHCVLVRRLLQIVTSKASANGLRTMIRRETLIYLLSLGALLIASHVRIGQLHDLKEHQPKYTVALIQSGNEKRLSNSMKMTQSVQDQVDLACWPESVLGSYSLELQGFTGSALQSEPRNRTRPLRHPRCDLLMGGTSFPRKTPKIGPFYNTAFLTNPSEDIIGRYHKRILIPFGEYIPGEHWFPSLHDFSPFPHRFESGKTDAPLIGSNGAKIGVLICYEDVEAALARRTTLSGAQVLINLTNDFWFGRSAALKGHMQLALFRAIENRRYLLRATTTGVSAVISPTGQIVDQAPSHELGSLLATIELLDLMTFYTRFGDCFAWLCVAITLIQLARVRRPPTMPVS